MFYQPKVLYMGSLKATLNDNSGYAQDGSSYWVSIIANVTEADPIGQVIKARSYGSFKTAERALAAAMSEMDAGDVQLGSNMLFFTPRDSNPDALRSHMADAGIRIGGQSPAIRMALHRDVSDDGLEATITAFQSYFTKK